MVEIITPDEVRKSRKDYIPEVIFKEINKLLIVENFDGVESKVYQEDIINRVCTGETGLTSSKIFEKHYLDIEDIYKDAGWKVTYDKPGYCETYKAYFIFRAVR